MSSILLKLSKVTAAVVLFAFLIFLGLRVGQTRLMFFPSRYLKATPETVNLDYQSLWIPVKNQQLYGWFIPAQNSDAPVILYFNGNASNIGDVVNKAARFHEWGWSVILVDYRGYGKSSPPFPNETRVYRDAEATWQYLTETLEIDPAKIVIYGWSIGGAVAIDLAAKHPEAGALIVEASFTSMKDMTDYKFKTISPLLRLALTQEFDSLQKVDRLEIPVLYLCGTQDSVVPPEMTQQLYAASPQPKELLVIPNATHTSISREDETLYRETVRSFVRQWVP
ncbi:alpha/beta hydrolase [Baaleninema sp.]|uniref:alpha/beta hydrolase n=1 Tax=Baaleninema sp. TaxID=3101197 RepID=UPI003D040232